MHAPADESYSESSWTSADPSVQDGQAVGTETKAFLKADTAPRQMLWGSGRTSNSEDLRKMRELFELEEKLRLEERLRQEEIRRQEELRQQEEEQEARNQQVIDQFIKRVKEGKREQSVPGQP